jgi:hypothetical protein
MSSTRKQNRETFIRLFQGFVNEYGPVDGEKIIEHMARHQIGGQRIWVPAPGPDPLSRCGKNFSKLWRDTCSLFGRASGRAVMNKIMIELGGRRVFFPDYQDWSRWARNWNIQNQLHRGDDPEVVAGRWGLSRQSVMKISKDELN